MLDLRGSKATRKRWIHWSENVTAIIFVASLDCYDGVMIAAILIFADKNIADAQMIIGKRYPISFTIG